MEELSFTNLLKGIEVDSPARPSAPIQPKCLPQEVEQRLNDRIADEYVAHYAYRNAANWCRGANYKKAAVFFDKEAENELEHAKGLQDYIVQWNGIPQLPAIDPTQKFGSLVEIVNFAYQLEYDLLNKYSHDQVELTTLHPATHNFIQGYVTIQNEAVAEYSDLLNALQLINSSNRFEVLYFEQTYF